MSARRYKIMARFMGGFMGGSTYAKLANAKAACISEYEQGAPRNRADWLIIDTQIDDVIWRYPSGDLGSTSTPSAAMLERERCLQLLEARVRRLESNDTFPPDHPHAAMIRASVDNLKTCRDWIAMGLTAEQTADRNPGGDVKEER